MVKEPFVIQLKVRVAYSSYYGVEGDEIDLKVYPLLEEQYDTVSYYSNRGMNYGPAIADTNLVLGPKRHRIQRCGYFGWLPILRCGSVVFPNQRF